MTDEFEKTLRHALRRKDPGEDLASQVLSRLGPDDAEPAATARPDSSRVRSIRSLWLPAALAACLIAGFGFIQMRQHDLDAARASHARAQLLQALSIASENLNIVRTAVAREENPDS